MTSRRGAIILTGVLLAGLGVLFLLAGLDRADKIASVIGALATVSGLGLSAWTLLGPTGGADAPTVRVRRSGSISQVSDGRVATANTGVQTSPSGADRPTVVDRSGNIEQEGGGDANTGVRQ